MSSIYFQITSSGYKRSDRQPPVSVDRTKKIPVYRTVNEFMDLQNKQQTQNRNEQNQFIEGVNLESNSEKGQKQCRNVKFVAINSFNQQNQDETNSIKTDDLGSELRKPEKSLSMYQHKTKLTAIPDPSNPNIRQYTLDAKTQKSTLNLQEPQHSNIYYELQKEKALRQNLQKSYRSLLEKIEKNESSSKEDEQTWNFEQIGRKKQRHSTQQPMTERLNKCEFLEMQSSDSKDTKKQKNKNMRSSCCNFNQVGFEDEIKNQDLELEQQHLNLISQNEIIQQRIVEDMQLLRNKLVQVENKMLQIQLHQKEQELHNVQKEVQAESLQKQNATHNIPNKQRLHYLFTILVMFLCMSLMSKK